MADGLLLSHISFAVGNKEILRDVTVEAPVEETTAILGPSGCGKTTLLRVAAGLERPSEGEVFFGGENLTETPPHRRGFGMMFQDFALFPHLDVAGNVGFGLRHSSQPRRQRTARVAELLELVGLTGYEKRTIETLSGGERQRVALARALAPQPRLLMLDEPLGSLDRTLRERLLLELRGILGRLRVPALYVTHDQLEAFALADRIVIMDAGRILRTGAPAGIHAEPRTPFVARFLGMDNILPGVVAGGRVTTSAGEWPVAGSDGPATVLLRTEGAAPSEGPGEGVVSGVVRSRLFQGTRTRIAIETGGVDLEFELPADAALPAEGEAVHLHVPAVQLLEAE